MTNTEIRAKAADIIRARRDAAALELKKTISEIYSVSHELSEIEQEFMATMKSLCMSAVEGNDETTAQLKQYTEQLMERRKLVLAGMGLSDDIFTPKYTCMLCEDTGFYENGRCKCFKKLCEELATSELPQRLGDTNADFESFDLNYYAYDNEVYEYMKKLTKAAQEYAESDAINGKNLLLVGGTGCGKTHLALSIAKRALNYNTVSRAIFTSAFSICEAVECERFERRNPTPEQIRLAKDIFTVPMLIIDSLDTIRNRDDDRATLYNLIDTRLTAGLPTIITTYMKKDDIREKCGDKIFAKLGSAYTLYQLKGKDIRICKVNNKI